MFVGLIEEFREGRRNHGATEWVDDQPAGQQREGIPAVVVHAALRVAVEDQPRVLAGLPTDEAGGPSALQTPDQVVERDRTGRMDAGGRRPRFVRPEDLSLLGRRHAGALPVDERRRRARGDQGVLGRRIGQQRVEGRLILGVEAGLDPGRAALLRYVPTCAHWGPLESILREVSAATRR
ncbi:hypothetical protein MKK50_15765 [Methylobacterium sp. J-043]|uniref:hypothetical protein n=1 Tax=Methylobacteriaceae TaxID=119045 RepID=UPI0012E35228|nr:MULTISPECIES: hypothetical protein [Methylobacteriaceae]MCJ2030829.1 hypothetical protein [Methylobacterium sp. J-043]UYW33831.1 hypothetical protein OKB92_07050 [Methylorubrum extorquens]